MDWIKSSISKPKKKSDPGSTSSGSSATTSSSTSTFQLLDDLLARNGVSEGVLGERIAGFDLASYVSMPTGLDRNEWLASHTVAFFDHFNLLYGCVSDTCLLTCCQSASFSTLSSGSYQWVDEKGKKSKCHAPQFMENVMSYVQRCVEDEAIFPTKYGNKFPSNFESTVRKIHLRLYQVLSHLYVCHLKDVVNLQLQACLNTVSYHFLVFSREFRLLEDKDSTEAVEAVFRLLQAAAREPGGPGLASADPTILPSSSPSSSTFPRSLTPPPTYASSPKHTSLSQPRHRSERSPAVKAFLGQSSRLKSPFKSKEGVARDRKGSAPFRPLSIAT